MASQTIRRTNPSSKVLSCKKTECLICFQAGNPNYVNHRIKDASGKVVCPTLLKQKCHICKQTGHTPKYCTISKMKKTFVKHHENKKIPIKNVPFQNVHTQTNTMSNTQYQYDVLESFEFEPYEESKEDDSTNTPSERNTNSWASIVATPTQITPLQIRVPTVQEIEDYPRSPSTTPPSPPRNKNHIVLTPSIEEDNMAVAVAVVTETSNTPIVSVKKPRPKLWSQYESDEEYE